MSSSAAAASASASLPPPPPVSHVINNNDHGAIITVVATVLLIFSTLLLCLRLWARWPWKALLGVDDGCALVAHFFGITQTITVLATVPVGLGKKPDLLLNGSNDRAQGDLVEMEKLIYATDLLFVITVWLTRVSVALIFYRLASNRQRRRGMIYFAIGISVLSLASLLIVSLREQPLTPWRDALQMSTLYRWITVGALAAVIEFVLAAFAVLLVWDLQMKPRDKGRVVTGFAIRLIVLVPIVLRLLSLHSHATTSPAQPISFLFIMPELWTQLELHLCLVAATVPCLRLFLKSFSTGYFGMAISQLDPTGTVLATKGDSYNMSNMKSGAGSSSAGERYKIGNPTQQQVSKAGMTTSKVTHELREDRADSLSDRSDRGILVRQTVNVAYGP